MKKIYKEIMSGTSNAFPLLVTATLILAIGETGWLNDYSSQVKGVGHLGISLFLPIFSSGIAVSNAGKIAYAPGLIIGGIASYLNLGLLGAIVGAYCISTLLKLLDRYLSKYILIYLRPTVYYPICVSLLGSLIFILLIAGPIGMINNTIMILIQSMNVLSRVVASIVLGLLMIVDMGGPINKSSSLFMNGLYLLGVYQAPVIKMTGGMVAPIGIGIAKYFEKDKSATKTIIQGACFITESLIPHYENDRRNVMISSIIGTIISCGLVGYYNILSYAIQGGLIVSFTFSSVINYWLALGMGIIATTSSYLLLRMIFPKPNNKEVAFDFMEEIK